MSDTNMTTTKGFRVEDVTFKNARKQSEIRKEIEAERPDSVPHSQDIKAPVSLTPEQVKNFLTQKIERASDSNEKRLYSQCICWIDKLFDIEKKFNAIMKTKESFEKAKLLSDDIGEDI